MRKSVVAFLLIAVVALLAQGCSSAPKQQARARKNFPARRAPKRQTLSPIGGYVATAETPNPKKPQRDMIITRPGEKREILRYPFQRRVDVVWAPDETRVAVVDLVLENETRVVIFELPSGQPLFELRREHVCEFDPQLPCGAAYTHVYFSNVVWLAPDRFEVTVDMANPLDRNLPPQIHAPLVVNFGAPAQP